MSCKSCQAGDGTTFQIRSIRANPQVRYNENYRIIISIENTNWIGGAYARVCLYEGTTVIASSGSQKISAGETLDVTFSGVMPNRSLELKASVVQEAMGFLEYCNDAKYVSIALAKYTTTPPPTPPTVTPSTSPTGGYEEPGYEKPEIGGWFDDLFQNDDIGGGLLDGVEEDIKDIGGGLLDGVGEDIKDIADTTTKNILFIGGILILLVIIIAMLKFR